MSEEPPVHVDVGRATVTLTKLGREKLCDHLCTCPYLLPSMTTPDPSHHREGCPYRETMARIELEGVASVLLETNEL